METGESESENKIKVILPNVPQITLTKLQEETQEPPREKEASSTEEAGKETPANNGSV